VRDHPEGKQTKHTPEGELGTEVTINTGRPLVGSNNLARGAEPGTGHRGGVSSQEGPGGRLLSLSDSVQVTSLLQPSIPTCGRWV
jgi:hypothetical protein